MLHIAKCPESASNMVEHAVQYHPNPCFMQLLANLSKILIAAESAVNQAKIAGIIAVAVRFKQRGKIDGIAAKTFDMVDPVDNFSDTVAGRLSFFQSGAGSAAESDGVDLIEHAFIKPHKKASLKLAALFILYYKLPQKPSIQV